MFHFKVRLTRFLLLHREPVKRTFCISTNDTHIIENLQHFLDIAKHKAEYIVQKQPSVTSFNVEHLRQVTETVEQLGINKRELIIDPVLFTYLPCTLRNRYKVLKECGVQSITASMLSRYLNLVKKHTISKLKDSKVIPPTVSVGCRLADIFTEWPMSRSTSVWKIDEDKFSLLDVRMKVLQRYLEQVIDLPEEEFYKAVERYVRMKHRSFESVNEILMLLHKNILMPNEKIRNNLNVLTADQENIKRLLYELRRIAGYDIKEIIKMRPKFCNTRVDNILAIEKIFDEYGVRHEARIRCFDIYTLSPTTVRERLDRARTIPEFEALLDNPRLLKIILYENKALERLKKLNKSNKKCVSLNVLSGSAAHYRVYEKAPGDTSKGRDLVLGLNAILNYQHSVVKLRTNLKRHPFWTNKPLVHIKCVHKKLSAEFCARDIFENLSILLYPWDKIEMWIDLFSKKCTIHVNADHPELHAMFDHMDFSKLTKSQILSLTLYLMEKDHYFSGNGIWTDEKLKQITENEEHSRPVKSVISNVI